jgi:hypothetical protein
MPIKEVSLIVQDPLQLFYFFAFQRRSASELAVTDTELAAIARPASAGYNRPIAATAIRTMLYMNA